MWDIVGFCICFFNCQGCKCGQLSHNYINRDLGNPNFSSTATVILLFSWKALDVYIFKLRLQDYSCTPQDTYEFIYSYIFIFIPSVSSYREIYKYVIGFHGRDILKLVSAIF